MSMVVVAWQVSYRKTFAMRNRSASFIWYLCVFVVVLCFVHSSFRLVGRACICSFHLSKLALCHMHSCVSFAYLLICVISLIDSFAFLFTLFTLSATPYRVYGCIFAFKLEFMIASCGLRLVAYLIVFVGVSGVCVIRCNTVYLKLDRRLYRSMIFAQHAIFLFLARQSTCTMPYFYLGKSSHLYFVPFSTEF